MTRLLSSLITIDLENKPVAKEVEGELFEALVEEEDLYVPLHIRLRSQEA